MARKDEEYLENIEQITKSCPMEYLCSHPFFMVRWIETNRRRTLLRAIDPRPGEVIADVGCERGHMLSMIWKRCPDIGKLYGLDLSRHAIGEAKRAVEWEGFISKCEFIHCDASDIKLPENSVDVAVSSNVLEHLPDIQKGFDELVRITRPTGRIILNLPNERRIVALKKSLINLGLRRLLGNLEVTTPGHLHYPDRGMIEDLCRGRGVIERLFSGPRISIFGLYSYTVIKPVKK